MKNMTKCEGCEQEKEVTNIEDHILCKECAEEIVRCDFCHKVLAASYDDLEIDNFGRLAVPELALPDKQSHLKFCNLDCLEAYLKKYRQELKEQGIECGC